MAACECCVLKASQNWRETVEDITAAATESDFLSAAAFLSAIRSPHVRRTRRDIPLPIRRVAARACAAVVQLVDVRRRFCSGQHLPRVLLLARDKDGTVVGTAGLEPAVWNRTEHIVYPSHKGEAHAVVALDGGAPVLPAGFELSSMITCVAVDASLRRTGLAQEICTRLDAIAGEWQLGHSVLMQVVQSNQAARWLAAKMGYREGFRVPQPITHEVIEPIGIGDDLDEEAIFVTLGKKIGPVTWRLCAPVPPY